MDELNKTAATEPETRPEAAKLQDAPRRRVLLILYFRQVL